MKASLWVFAKSFDPARFFSTAELAWQAYLKKAEVELELPTEIDMLLMVEKSIKIIVLIIKMIIIKIKLLLLIIVSCKLLITYFGCLI